MLKQSAINLGIYRQARWLVDHTIRRNKLASRRKLASVPKEFVLPGTLCFDVGANVGSTMACPVSS